MTFPLLHPPQAAPLSRSPKLPFVAPHDHDRHTGIVARARNDKLGHSTRASSLMPPLPKSRFAKRTQSRRVYDDPAFSPNPLLHPFHDAWILAAGAANPRSAAPAQLEEEPRIDILTLPLNHLTTPMSPSAADEMNYTNNTTPGWVDDSTTTLSHETTSSSSASTSSHSTPPTSHESHSFDLKPFSPPTPTVFASPDPVAKLTSISFSKEKKSSGVSMFWRKIHLEPKAEFDQGLERRPDQPAPPSYTVAEPPCLLPAKTRDQSRLSPEKSLRDRFVSDTKRLPPSAAARHINSGVAINARELDRIDELDETDPMGLPVHHGGRYEVALKALAPLPDGRKNKALHIGSEDKRQVLSSFPMYDMPRRQLTQPRASEAPIPYVPPGTSLNLVPGQVLPYDFQAKYMNRTRGNVINVVPPEAGRLPVGPEKAPSNTDARWPPDVSVYNSLNDFVNPMHMDAVRHAAAPQQFEPKDHLHQPINTVSSSSGKAFLSRQLMHEEGPNFSTMDPRAQYPGARTPSMDRLPPRLHRDSRLPPRMQALRRGQGKTAGETSRLPSRPSLESWEFVASKESVPMPTASDTPLQNKSMTMEKQIRPLPLPSDVLVVQSKPDLTPSLESHMQNSQEDEMPQASRPARDADGRSLKFSIDTATISTNSASSGGSRNMPSRARPAHAPKHLVMPAPLQMATQPLTVAPRHRTNPPPPRYKNVHELPPRHRPPSPAEVNLPFGYTHGHSKPPQRAQDVPMFVPHNNKLRKRGNAPPPLLPGLPETIVFPPSSPSFDPFIEYPLSATLAPSYRSKRNVLSKRRTDM